MPCSPAAGAGLVHRKSLEDGGGMNSEAVSGWGRENRAPLTHRWQAGVCLQNPEHRYVLFGSGIVFLN